MKKAKEMKALVLLKIQLLREFLISNVSFTANNRELRSHIRTDCV